VLLDAKRSSGEHGTSTLALSAAPGPNAGQSRVRSVSGASCRIASALSLYMLPASSLACGCMP